jgi:predicted methyltransferase
MRRVLPLLLLLAACGGSDPEPAPAPTPEPTAGEEAPVAEVTIPSGDLAAAIAGEHRSEENRARDAYRHPLETLQFFGIEPSMRVIEVRPGRGWYTEILAPYLRGEGQLIAAVPSADGERARYRQRFVDFTQTMPELYGDIELVTFEPPSPIRLGPDGSVDAVVTFRNTHNWIGDNGAREAYEAFFRVLRPGGVLGVVQHRASDSADTAETAPNGYVTERYIIELCQEVGFVFEESSDVNRNPRDRHDYPGGVWTLPPVLRLGDEDRARYEAIGESDRMTLRFRRPAL